MPHIVLLGDSVFDNGAYVGGGPDVCALLRRRLPPGWRATLCAVDGATAADIPPQVRRLPADATHLVLSAGGNDALMHEHLLLGPPARPAETLLRLAEAVDGFEAAYRSALQPVLATGLPVTLCTVYDANFADPLHARCVRLAVALFDDVILRVARERALPTIDLRTVCASPADYANDIEPSVTGGGRIADAIAVALGLAGST